MNFVIKTYEILGTVIGYLFLRNSIATRVKLRANASVKINLNFKLFLLNFKLVNYAAGQNTVGCVNNYCL